MTALFLSARGIPARSEDGRLSVRAINQILDQIGLWHDAEVRDPTRRISPLRPHDLRHTFRTTGITAYLKNGGSLEHAQHIANHSTPRTTKLYNRRQDGISLAEVERIAL